MSSDKAFEMQKRARLAYKQFGFPTIGKCLKCGKEPVMIFTTSGECNKTCFFCLDLAEMEKNDAKAKV